MAKSSGPFMVIYGDDDYLLDSFVDRRRKIWKNRTLELVDGDGLSVDKLISLCETSSFFDEGGRAVVLDNAHEMKTDKALAAYIESKDPKDLSTLLLVVVREKNVTAVWKEASKKGTLIGFLKPKPWETEKSLARIAVEAKELGLKLDNGVPEALVYFLGNNLRSVVNELNKLKHVVGEDNLVKKEHLSLVICASVTAEPHEVADAALSKNLPKAMRAMALIYKELGESSCVPVVAALMKRVEQTLLIRHLLDKGEPPSVISARITIHEFVCKNTLIPVAQKHTVKSLVGQMNNLCRLDAQVKGPARSKRTLIELAVLSIAA